MQLKDKGVIPWGGIFKLDLPQLGLVGSGSDWNMLVRNIQAYRKANGLPNGLGLEQEIEREVCNLYPRECNYSIENLPPVGVKIGWSEVVAGTKVLIQTKLSGRIESQDEANRRASICARCPMKADVQLQCAGLCGDLAAVVTGIIGGRETTSHSQIDKKCCGVCSCYLTAIPWVPLDIQQSVLNDGQRQRYREVKAHFSDCWKANGL